MWYCAGRRAKRLPKALRKGHCPGQKCVTAALTVVVLPDAVLTPHGPALAVCAEFHILKRINCMGGKPAVLSLRRGPAAAESSAGAGAAAGAAPSSAAGKASKAKAAKAAPAPAPEPPLPPGVERPKYRIVHRDAFELANHTNDRVASGASRPRELVVSVELPKLVR